MNKCHLHWKLSGKLLAAAACSFLGAVLVFVLLYETVLPELFYGNSVVAYWNKKGTEAIEDFSRYASEQQFTVKQALRDQQWDKENPTVELYREAYDPEYPQEWYFPEDEDTYPARILTCIDGKLFLCAYPSDTYFGRLSFVFSLIVAAVVFEILFLPFITHLLKRIIQLSEKTKILARGNWVQELCVKGSDEFSDLTRDIEMMRQSILEKIEAEKEALAANQNLITTLSHDLRSPLTVLNGYIEILKYKKYRTPEESELFLQKISEKTLQIRNLSDEIFEYFQLQKSDGLARNQYGPISGTQLFNQILEEEVFTLEVCGFSVIQPRIQTEFFLQVYPEDILRVFANLFSNLQKYADAHFPVKVLFEQTPEEVHLVFNNHIKQRNGKKKTEGFGISNMRIILSRNQGRLEVEQTDTVYQSTLTFTVYQPRTL